MSFRVRLTWNAKADLGRLFDFVEERELTRDGGDLARAERGLAAIRAGISTLQISPFTCRKAGRSPFLRELIIPFGHSGCVALFEIEDASNILVVAVRHQLETTTTERQRSVGGPGPCWQDGCQRRARETPG